MKKNSMIVFLMIVFVLCSCSPENKAGGSDASESKIRENKQSENKIGERKASTDQNSKKEANSDLLDSSKFDEEYNENEVKSIMHKPTISKGILFTTYATSRTTTMQRQESLNLVVEDSSEPIFFFC